MSIGFFFGTFFGQATLAAAWTASGPGPLKWRISLSIVWVAMLPVAIVINLGIHGGPDDAAFVIGACIGACLFGQWLRPVRCGCVDGVRLRLRHVDDGEGIQDHRERQFGIRHLMVLTTIVGVVLGVGRGWLGAAYRPDPRGPVSSSSWLARRSP